MISPFVSVPRSCDETVTWLERRLRRYGLEVTQIVDVKGARLSMEGCPCPHHGTQACDCEVVVAVVYGRTPLPASLMLHGSGSRTWISLVTRAEGNADPGMVSLIQRVLNLDDSGSARSSVFAWLHLDLGHWRESWRHIGGK